MRKLLSLLPFLLLLSFILLLNLFFPSKVTADCPPESPTFFSYCRVVVGGGGGNCGDDALFDQNCNQPSMLCQINPFCTKYTGTQCCTAIYDSNNNQIGGLGFETCSSTGFSGSGCAPLLQSLQISCCNNPTPTPIPPTPTSVPTPTPTPSAPACWTCDSSLYSSWIGDSWCDDGQQAIPNHSGYACGETSNTASACYSAACVVTTPTPTHAF